MKSQHYALRLPWKQIASKQETAKKEKVLPLLLARVRKIPYLCESKYILYILVP